VAPLEFLLPERVWSLFVERMVRSAAPEEKDGCRLEVREAIRARLGHIIHKVWRSLSVAQRRYKRTYNARVRPVNKDIQAGDWVFDDGHGRTKKNPEDPRRPGRASARRPPRGLSKTIPRCEDGPRCGPGGVGGAPPCRGGGPSGPETPLE